MDYTKKECNENRVDKQIKKTRVFTENKDCDKKREKLVKTDTKW